MLPEVRMARVLDAIRSHHAKRLSCVEAGELLGGAGQRFRQAKPGGMASGGMSERHFRRLRDAYEERGEDGLIDRRRGHTSGLRAQEDAIAWTADTFRTRYFDFTIKHFHEQALGRTMQNGKPFKRSYSWTKSVLQLRGLTTKAQKRGVHRRKRERRPLPGMMLFQPFG